MNNEYDIALVEKYFDNELTEAETAEFRERLSSDESFKLLVDQEKVLIQGIRLEGLSKDLRFLKSVESKYSGTETIQIGSYRKMWYYAAAAIATLAVAAVGYFAFGPKDSTDELFAQYYEPYVNAFEPIDRGGVNTPPTARAEAFQAYEGKDYARAATLFGELLKTEKDPGMLLLLGNSNLMLGRIAEAKQNFTTLLNDYDELDIQAKWFLSLCYLKDGDLENARKMLKELGEMEVSYADKAKELLKRVD